MNRRAWLIAGAVFAAGGLVAYLAAGWYATRMPAAQRHSVVRVSPVYMRDSTHGTFPAHFTTTELIVVISPSDVECMGQAMTHDAAPASIQRLLREQRRTEIVVQVAPGTVYSQVVSLIDRLRTIGADLVWLDLKQPDQSPKHNALTRE